MFFADSMKSTTQGVFYITNGVHLMGKQSPAAIANEPRRCGIDFPIRIETGNLAN